MKQQNAHIASGAGSNADKRPHINDRENINSQGRSNSLETFALHPFGNSTCWFCIVSQPANTKNWRFAYLGRKLVGSRRKVTSKLFKKEFIPVNKLCGFVACARTEGSPSNTITRSARYVAIIKSCSTINAVFLACKMNRLMTLAAIIRCSESK